MPAAAMAPAPSRIAQLLAFCVCLEHVGPTDVSTCPRHAGHLLHRGNRKASEGAVAGRLCPGGRGHGVCEFTDDFFAVVSAAQPGRESGCDGASCSRSENRERRGFGRSHRRLVPDRAPHLPAVYTSYPPQAAIVPSGPCASTRTPHMAKPRRCRPR